MDVSVLLVSFRTRDLTLGCLESIEATIGDLEAEVIVVDNCSGDGTVDAVRARFPDVDMLALDDNVGFARAANLAATRATGRHLLLLNPDAVVHAGAIAALVAFADANPDAGIVGGRTLRPDGNVDPSSCWGAPTPWSLACFAIGASAVFRRNAILDPESLGAWPRDTVRAVGVVTGCLCLVPRDAWARLGGLDPRFFMYGEDVDLCVRARGLGYRPTITPDATITHLVGASSATSSAKRQLVLTGKATLIRKHWASAAPLGVGLLQVGVGLRAAIARARRRPDDQWRHCWHHRREWVGGYDPSPDIHQPAPATPGV